MPKMQIVTDAMLDRASRIGQASDLMFSNQNAVTQIFQNMGRNFSGRVPGLMTQHILAMESDYKSMNTILTNYRNFMEDAARNYNWTENELASWAESLGNGEQTGSSGNSDNTGTSTPTNDGGTTTMGGTTSSNGGRTASDGVSQNNYDNPREFIRDFLREKIGNDYGVAALMGNLHAESGMRANNLQNSNERSIGLDDDEYTAAVDDGSYDNFVHDSAGYGIAQWTYYSRKQKLLDFAREKGTSVGDLQTQMEFLWKELSEGYPGVVETLQTTSSIREASDIVLKEFERPADQSESACARRASYGESLYSEMMA